MLVGVCVLPANSFIKIRPGLRYKGTQKIQTPQRENSMRIRDNFKAQAEEFPWENTQNRRSVTSVPATALAILALKLNDKMNPTTSNSAPLVHRDWANMPWASESLARKSCSATRI
jgi:hypothetical protein